MKKVPICEIKRVLMTRHGRPTATLEASGREYLVVGERSGRARLRPALRNASRGKFLEVLAADRRGRA
jgi:hypothetical protein